MKRWKSFTVFAIVCFALAWTLTARAQEIVIGFSGPLSGPAAEYGQDMVNGIDMAINEINNAGGITVGGQKYKFRLERLDDKADPTHAVTNARRLRGNGAMPFSTVLSPPAAIGKINEEKVISFSSGYTTRLKCTIWVTTPIGITAPPFTVYADQFVSTAMKKGYKKVAMVVTLGAYGEEWRVYFKDVWTKAGGVITADKPANYYTETDFSAPLTAALATSPDCILIGGPSATTALVVEQARSMGFKGGFIIIDQAKLDYMANLLKGYKLMENTIGVATPMSVPVPASVPFEKRFKAAYKRMVTSECFRNYGGMTALAKAIEKAGTTTDVRKIRADFYKALPINGDHIPTEIFGIRESGQLLINGSTQNVEKGQLTPPIQYFWWVKTDQEWEDIKKVTKSKANMVRLTN